MTTLYRPVLIESAEQAEALPVGTIAMSAQDGGGVWRKRSATSWAKASMTPSLWTNHGIANPDAAITALVPIEAEEVRVIEHGLIEIDMQGREVLYQEPTPGSRDYRRTEYRTPWEEA